MNNNWLLVLLGLCIVTFSWYDMYCQYTLWYMLYIAIPFIKKQWKCGRLFLTVVDSYLSKARCFDLLNDMLYVSLCLFGSTLFPNKSQSMIFHCKRQQNTECLSMPFCFIALAKTVSCVGDAPDSKWLHS